MVVVVIVCVVVCAFACVCVCVCLFVCVVVVAVVAVVRRVFLAVVLLPCVCVHGWLGLSPSVCACAATVVGVWGVSVVGVVGVIVCLPVVWVYQCVLMCECVVGVDDGVAVVCVAVVVGACIVCPVWLHAWLFRRVRARERLRV